MGKLSDGEILYAIITAIEKNSPDGLCQDCPVIQMIKDIECRINEEKNRKITKEMGIEFSPKKCPCLDKFKNQMQ